MKGGTELVGVVDNDDNDDDDGGVKVLVMIADIVFGGAMLRDWYIYEYFISFLQLCPLPNS